MIIKEVRERISEVSPNAVLFDNPSFDASIIGIEYSSGAVIYNLCDMVEELAKDDNMSHMDAVEFIDYNTVRVIPYINDGVAPIICDSVSLW